ncbi:MAG: glycoside hydrolase family 16 protein [Acidobacteriia bacterium]|nr:glycoside hydrolase family 16 protein [Terriglobia bacterium]
MKLTWQPFLAMPVLAALLLHSAESRGRQSSAAPAEGQSAWVLVWSDEFNGANGSRVDPAKWVFDTGGGGWGNAELEYYTSRPENAFVQDGHLVIRARREKYTGPDGVTRDYTSARLKTLGRFETTYGRIEARIQLPAGQGMWPAFWMLGTDIEKAGWPACGEADIMENIGREPSVNHGSLHGPGYSGSNSFEAHYTLPAGQRFADEFHVFAMEWEPGAIRFYVDGQLYVTRTPADLHAGQKWVFDHPFFLLLNVAVGGDWPGSPDETTVFPQTMLVDYVRVYRHSAH